ncbi:PREDICTED: sentrin-specific protease 6-like, partial [Priapulus caudatus]|uniref:Sentrin-specific protease 6-like n=1 Tax=Priapulus caudatus TaxID=37621 RepID=A0ABM1F6M6_PRICU
AHWFLAIVCFPWLDRQHATVARGNPGGGVPDTSALRQQILQNSPLRPSCAVVAPSPVKPTKTDSLEQQQQQQQGSPAGKAGPSPAPSSDGSSLGRDPNEEVCEGQREEADDAEAAAEDAEEERTDAASRVVVAAETPSKQKEMMLQPCILIFDSLVGMTRSKVICTLRDYLQVEWTTRREAARAFTRDSIRGCTVKCPQQDNYSDCGVYLLQYVESFYETPLTSFNLPIRLPVSWFPVATIQTKRKEVQELIWRLHEEQNPKQEGATAAK